MNVPQLRFSGFCGEWEEQELSELLEFKNGINADKDSYGHGTKFINVLDILNNDYILSENIIGSVNASEQQLKTYSVTYGDILFLRSSETREDVGKCNVYLDEEKPAVFGGFVIRGKKIADYSPFFLKAVLNNSSARNQISSKAGGSTRYNVGQSILSEVTVRVPQIEEQQKISSFFMLLNKKIEKQQEKIEKLQQFKTGMMRKVFSQELRFKDEAGVEFPVWIFASISQYIKVSGGYAFKSNKFVKTGIPIVRISNIDNRVHLNQGTVYYPETEAINEDFVVTKGSLLIAMSGATTGKTGIFVDSEVAYLNQRVGMFISKDNLYYPFIYQLVESPAFKKQLNSLLVTGAQPNISSKQIESIQLHFPTYTEQRKIADYLLLVDSKIEREKEKLMVLEEQKKGFMWGMFV